MKNLARSHHEQAPGAEWTKTLSKLDKALFQQWVEDVLIYVISQQGCAVCVDMDTIKPVVDRHILKVERISDDDEPVKVKLTAIPVSPTGSA